MILADRIFEEYEKSVNFLRTSRPKLVYGRKRSRPNDDNREIYKRFIPPTDSADDDQWLKENAVKALIQQNREKALALRRQKEQLVASKMENELSVVFSKKTYLIKLLCKARFSRIHVHNTTDSTLNI